MRSVCSSLFMDPGLTSTLTLILLMPWSSAPSCRCLRDILTCYRCRQPQHTYPPTARVHRLRAALATEEDLVLTHPPIKL